MNASVGTGLKFAPIGSLDVLQLLDLRQDAIEKRDHQLAQRCLERLKAMARSPRIERVREEERTRRERSWEAP